MRRAWVVLALLVVSPFLVAARLGWRGSDAGVAGWWSVTDFGAVGDGITNDCAAIQAAIDAAEVDGGTVYFPQGTYRCRCPLTINSHSVILLGTAVADSVQYTRGSSIEFRLDAAYVGHPGLTIGARNDSTIQNVRIRELGIFSGFQSNSIYEAGVSHMGHLIYACGVNNLVIENCQIDDSYGKADTGYAAVYLTADSTGVNSVDNTIENCRIFCNWAKSGGDVGHGLMLACNADNTHNNSSRFLNTNIINVPGGLCACRISAGVGTARDCDGHQFVGGGIRGRDLGGGRVVIDGDDNVFQAYSINVGHADSLAIEFTDVAEDNIFEGTLVGLAQDAQVTPEHRAYIQLADINWPEHTELMMNLLRDWTPSFRFLTDSTGAAAIWYGNRDGGAKDTLFIWDAVNEVWDEIYVTP